ncbi:hypothetical protein G6F56_009790 [Rhizopus delemar]|nr:hypothetical protein G6F56_009790 [Rhizopus delemar]
MIFHVFGFFCLASAAFAGASSVFLEKLPPSQEDIDLALRVNKCTAMTAPPLILEQMIPFLKKTNDLSAVQHLKFVLFAGAPLKRESGNWFISHDVKVRNAYGSTEMGPVMCSDLSPDNKNWNSITPVWNTPGIKSSCFFEDAENGLKHFYTTGDCPMKAMNVSNRHDNGFDSNDLFREDPDSPGSYLYVGRRDDTLIMENGEKTNPIPMENTIRQSPVVYQVAVLGHGYQCTSALIEIDMKVAINYGPEEIIALVHEAVEDANNECPSHSVILPQMIKILPFNKSLPSTDKGTVIRKRAESMYKNLVETMYKNFLEGPQKKTDSDTSTWSAEQTEYFLVQSAAQVLRLPESALRDHQKSIFDLGLNSLTAIQLRNAISQNFNNVPQNFLFQHPSIRSMREALMSDEQVDPAEVMEARYQQTQALAESYLERAKNDFPVAKNDYEAKKKDKVVLLSGATGSLGSFMLRHLLQDKSVKKVYCLIRGQDSQLDSRLLKAFESRHLDVSLLKSSRVEALPMPQGRNHDCSTLCLALGL